MTVVPPPAEYGGRATAWPTVVRPSRGRVTEESVLPEPELSCDPSRAVVPLVLLSDLPVPVDPELPRGTACADRPSDDEPEGADTGAGADRAWPPPEPPLLEPPLPPSDPPLEALPPPEPPPRRCWALALGDKAKTNAADVKIARRLCRRSGTVRVIALLLLAQSATGLPSQLSSFTPYLRGGLPAVDIGVLRSVHGVPFS